VDQSIWLFIAVGFLAQLIDGALGMAYGVSSTTVLLSLGLPPAIASASVHAAEVFTTGVSGFSHFKFGNVDKSLIVKIVIPGVLGGASGAYILTEMPGNVIKPFVAVYLLAMGLLILYKAFRKGTETGEIQRGLIPLGFLGGFMDAIGGGGWGPIVTSTLVASGKHPRFAVGSVNLAEFFVTFSESITFVLTLGGLTSYWRIIVGLLIGGVIAAPLAAYVCKKIPTRQFMVLVGLLISVLSIRTIYLTLIQ
jgi:uncharacterized membrane protein YfcA